MSGHDELAATLVAVLRMTGPVTISPKEAERAYRPSDRLVWEKHVDGSLTVRVVCQDPPADGREQDAAGRAGDSQAVASTTGLRRLSVEQNAEVVAGTRLCWQGPTYSHSAHLWTEDKPGGQTWRCPGASTGRT